jgi:hypothetical protein
MLTSTAASSTCFLGDVVTVVVVEELPPGTLTLGDSAHRGLDVDTLGYRVPGLAEQDVQVTLQVRYT